MSTDPGELEPRAPRPDLALPAVQTLRIQRTRFAPRRRNFESALPASDNAVEFLVETAAAIPARALGPVLYVGDTPVTEVTVDDETHYRFVAVEPDELERGAPISLGWSGSSRDERLRTQYRFE
jgi:hypothetical protein